jgi:cold shock protein
MKQTPELGENFADRSNEHELDCSAVRSAVMEGTVKWFNNTRGYGFIGRDDGPDVFVHYTGIVGDGYKTLHEGETVQFEIVQGRQGPQAANVLQRIQRTVNS